MQTVVIIGCGDIGRRVGKLYQAKASKVIGLVKTQASAKHLKDEGFEACIHDLDGSDQLKLSGQKGATVFYFAPPPRQGTQDSRLRTYLQALTAQYLPKKVVLISTTAVYGDSQGEWVTEQTQESPGTDRGRRRLDAETTVLAWSAMTGVPVVILRVPGIYGPGRLPRTRLEKGLPVLRESESGYTNRIHADDLAMICIAAAERGQSGQVYNVSDGRPGTMTEWFNAVADHLGLPRPPQVSFDEAKDVVSEGMLSYLKESRRISNTKMIDELAVELMYPDLEQGIKSCD